MPLHLVLTPFGGLLLCYILKDSVRPALLCGWFTVLCALALARYLLVLAHRRAKPGPDRCDRWVRLLVLSSLAAGGVWGAERITAPGEMTGALSRAIAATRPHLIEAVIEGKVA